MRRYAPFLIIAGVAAITLCGGVILYRSMRPTGIPISTKAGTSRNDPGELEHTRGPANAPVTLEEFGDFQCPPCGTMAGAIQQIERDYGPNLRMIFRQYPLVTHQHAREAAMAAEAAGLQGRFWDMHNLLYQEQPVWSKAAVVTSIFVDYALRLNLDVARFTEDIRGERAKGRLAADQRRAAKLGVTMTPTIFINGRIVENASLNPAGLRDTIDAALKSKPSS